MSFDFSVIANASQALQETTKVVNSLQQIEANANAVGKSITDGFSAPALRDAQGRLLATSQASKTTAAAAANLLDKWEREEAMLAQIQGPLKQYMADLEALDGLLNRNAISTATYAEQVTALNKKIGEKPTAPPEAPEKHKLIEGNVGQAVAGQFGEAGSAFQQLASSGAIEAAALVAVSVEAVKLGDDYVELTNKTQKYVDKNHDLNTVINDQMNLSKGLHSGLDDTLELYDAVRDATDDLNLSYDRQVAITKTIGEVVQLSGKSLGDAKGFMEKLSFAFSTGTVNGALMKDMMKSFPDTADILTKAFGTSKKGIVDMADAGKISARDLANAFSSAGAEIDAKFGKRTETLGQQWQHFKDQLVTTVGKFVESSGVITVLGGVLSFLGATISAVVKQLTIVFDVIGSVVSVVGQMVKGFLDGTGITKVLSLTLSALAGVVGFVKDGIAKLGDAVSWLGDKFSGAGKVAEVAAGNLGSAFGGLFDMANDAMGRVQIVGSTMQTAMQVLQRSTQMVEAQGAAWDSWVEKTYPVFGVLKQIEAGTKLAGAALSEMPKILDDMNVSINRAAVSIGLMNDAWGESPNALIKANSAFMQGSKIVLDSKAAMAAAKVELAGLEAAFHSGQLPLDQYIEKHKELITTINGGSTPAWEAEAYAMKKAESDMVSLRIAAETGQKSWFRYRQEYRALATTLNGGEAPAWFKIIDDVKEPMRQLERDLQATQGLYKGNAISASEYGLEIHKVFDVSDDVDHYIESLNKLALVQSKDPDVYARGLAKLRAQYDDMRSPVEGYVEAVRLADEKLKAGVYSQNEYTKKLQALGDQYRSLKTPSEEYEAQYRQIVTAETTGLVSAEAVQVALSKLRAQYDDMRSPIEQYDDELTAAAQKYRDNIYNADEYSRKLVSLREQFTLFKTPGQEYAEDLRKIKDAEANHQTSAEGVKLAMDSLKAKYDDMQAPSAQYQADLNLANQKLHDNIYTQDEYQNKLVELADKYTAFKSPAEEYALALRKIQQAQQDGLTSTAANEDAMRKLRLQFNMGTAADGVKEGLAQIKSDVGDTATIISKTMSSAFQQINASIEEMVTTGKLDFNTLGSAFEKMLVDMSLKLLESQLLNFLAPGASEANGSTGLLSTLFGSAPGHKDGTQYVVGGPSGTDRSFQAFWASRGERVTVETRAQQAQNDFGRNSGGGMMVASPEVHIHNYVDPNEMVAAIPTRAGRKEVVNAIRQSPGAVQAAARANRRR